MPTLLVVDDEPNVVYSLKKGLRSDTLAVLSAQSALEGIAMVQRHKPDVVILDVRLTDMSGLEAFDQIRQIDPLLPVIIITAYAATETAIEAMKRGAFEYLLKPLDLGSLRAVVARAVSLSHQRHVPAVFEETDHPDQPVDRIVGHSPAMQEVYKAIGRVASQDVTVLILGESGTGKELVARAIYHHGRRSQGPFLTLNCAAIPEALLESELFGHERGAFTGADRQRIGKFEQADRGTIFLDEIGDMSMPTQAKVLRLLQEQRFERVGGNTTITTHVRLIAATNQPLEELVAAGRFRQDLFYRLKVFTIELPPLRARREDLSVLVEYYLKIFNAELGKKVQSVAAEAMDLMDRHDWPGNVRELQSAIKYALIHAAGEVLTADCLPASVRPAAPPPPETAIATAPLDVPTLVQGLLHDGAADIYRKVGQAVDRVVLPLVLRHVKGNQVQASELLGISRSTLRAKLRVLELTIEKQILVEPYP
jgi:two-component system nitrogen regulation response regulator GlnG